MIKILTTLRGIFILFIFFHHCLDLYPGGGTMAVTFFFVLGGFSMALGYKDRITEPSFSYKHYLSRRCIKFYPLHWLCLLAVMPLALFSFKTQQTSVFFAIQAFFANASLLQSWIPMENVYFSFNWVSWYLANTMFFSLMFPLLFKLIANSGTRERVLIAALFAITYAEAAILLPVEKYHAILYISPYMRLTDFVFGIYLALLYFKLKEQPVKWWNGSAGQIIVLGLLALLVVESCFLPENARMVAPVYWALVAPVILTAALIRRTGGGKIICWKPNGFFALAS